MFSAVLPAARPMQTSGLHDDCLSEASEFGRELQCTTAPRCWWRLRFHTGARANVRSPQPRCGHLLDDPGLRARVQERIEFEAISEQIAT